MSFNKQIATSVNALGENINQDEDSYFAPIKNEGETLLQNLLKEHVLYNAKYNELIELHKEIEKILIELTRVKEKTNEQLYQVFCIQNYLPKIRIRIYELEKRGIDCDIDNLGEFVTLRQRITKIKLQLNNYFSRPKL
jgi:hypothetical protein